MESAAAVAVAVAAAAAAAAGDDLRSRTNWTPAGPSSVMRGRGPAKPFAARPRSMRTVATISTTDESRQRMASRRLDRTMAALSARSGGGGITFRVRRVRGLKAPGIFGNRCWCADALSAWRERKTLVSSGRKGMAARPDCAAPAQPSHEVPKWRSSQAPVATRVQTFGDLRLECVG
jgi:hypothetical protein